MHPEAFTYIDGREEYVQIDPNDLYPYLLVNIGSGVSMIKVTLIISVSTISEFVIGRIFSLCLIFRSLSSCRWMEMESLKELAGQVLVVALFRVWEGF